MKNFRKLVDDGLIKDHPRWIVDNIIYETIMGSVAYGVSSDTSDCDVYAVCVPPKSDVFPFINTNLIYLFDKNPDVFEQYINHGIKSEDDLGGKGRTYDYTVFSIVKAFKLWSSGNPNCLEMLYTSNECIISQTRMFKNIRDNADIFLSKLCYNTFINYLSSQIHKAKIKTPEGKRKELVDNHGYDTKYVANSVRLAYLCETILTDHTLDLRRFKDHVKAIRRGEVSLNDVMLWLDEKERALIKIKQESKLPEKPDMQKIKSLLFSSLESHYGTLSNYIANNTIYEQAMKEISNILTKYKL